jgi:Spy/CpxP family protein refolding chaperone
MAITDRRINRYETLTPEQKKEYKKRSRDRYYSKVKDKENSIKKFLKD